MGKATTQSAVSLFRDRNISRQMQRNEVYSKIRRPHRTVSNIMFCFPDRGQNSSCASFGIMLCIIYLLRHLLIFNAVSGFKH